MSRLNRKFIQIILAVLITNIIQGQEIKTKEQAVGSFWKIARNKFYLGSYFESSDFSMKNEYLIFQGVKTKWNTKTSKKDSLGKVDYIISLTDSIWIEPYVNEYTNVKKNKNAYRIKHKTNYLYLNNINNEASYKTFLEAFHVLKSNFNPKEKEEYKLTELKKGKLANPNMEISEEQRKYIVQANAANEKKDYENALLLFRKATEINPYSYPAAYFNMALIHGNLENYYQAVYAMKQYLIIAPDAEDARKAQDKIYEWELNIIQ